VIGAPGSTLWLAAHEARLAWRGFIGGRRGRRRFVVLGIVGVVFVLAAFPIALALKDVEITANPVIAIGVDLAAAAVFTLMLSQTLAGATEALYSRGDLDLLFSSPLSPRKILTVRFLALAAASFAAFAVMLAPFLAPVALVGHWRWLAVLPLLGALALAASACGMVLAVGLFALIGPRRTRTVAQVLAALIGSALFLVSQARTILGGRGSNGVAGRIVALAHDPGFRLPPLADWPLRAALGEPVPLAAIAAASIAMFWVASAWLSRRFAADAAAAQGADLGRRHARHAPLRPFAGGAFAATFVKELRLLRRDMGLMSQVLLRVLYLLPAALVLVRNAGAHAGVLLPGGAGVLAFMAGQVGGSLTWITVSAEDAPELLACAPAPPTTLRAAKLAAGLTPLAILLCLPLAALIVLAPLVGLAATLGAAAAALAAALINAWYPSPGKRSQFRRRRTGSLLIAWAQLIVSALVGGATGLAAAGSPWALLPTAVAAIALLAMRRPESAIAEAFTAGG
jgi:ABC-2 type transport system permease protein